MTGNPGQAIGSNATDSGTKLISSMDFPNADLKLPGPDVSPRTNLTNFLRGSSKRCIKQTFPMAIIARSFFVPGKGSRDN